MKPILSLLSSAALLATSLLVSSCGAPNPTLQKEMDQNIIGAQQLEDKKRSGNTTGPQQGRGSQSYGYGSH